jgi:hypothetical protein
MDRRWLPVALLLVAAAGCAQPAGHGATQISSPAAAMAGPTVLPWTTSECRFLVVFLNANTASVQPYLPEGFTATGSATLPTASVGFEMHDCKSLQGLNETVTPGGYGALWGVVQPPAEAADPAAGGVAYFKWAVLVPDAPRRELLMAHGVPAHAGSAKVVPGAAPGTWMGTLDLSDGGTFTATLGSVGPERAARDLPFQEFSNATGGFADWRATTTHYTQGQGVGTWRAPADSVLARMVGASSGTAVMTTGVWSYDGGSIRLP